jgi:LysM repeat protein
MRRIITTRSENAFTKIMILLLAAALFLPYTGVSAEASTVEDRLVSTGMKYIGVPYEWGADPNQTKTFDCSSYTKHVFQEVGITLPRTAAQQYELGKSVSLQNAKVGDLVFFHLDQPGVPGHVGIYLGDMKMLNATFTKGVKVTDISTWYWQERYIGVKRILPDHTYTVQSGDTLWIISNKTGVTIDNLIKWNNLSSTMIMVGQSLAISEPETTDSGTTVSELIQEPAAEPSRKYHIVTSKDSLWIISQKYGVSMHDVAQWNNIQDMNIIIEGQKLYVEPPQATKYTVVSGDTLWILSQRWGVTIDAIKQASGLTSDMLYPGQTLIRP